MNIQLAEGVKLHIIPSKKFKTVSIKIKFKAELKKEESTKRSMIANLLEKSSQHYPTQTDFQEALSHLYGAHFGAGVSRKGNFHILSVSLNTVNDKYLSENGVVDKSIQFLHSALFYPNAFNGSFHKDTFVREMENMEDDFDAIYDNKEAYASRKIRELAFDTVEQQFSAAGRKEDLEDLTPENVFSTYEKMLKEDEIDIFVLGDVDTDAIYREFQSFTFQDRPTKKSSVFYAIKDSRKKDETEQHTVVQAKLNLAYRTGIYYHQEKFVAGQVFNGLFGGYPHSKLFVNVREKESLAYYASSGLDTFRGTMFVQTGIDQKEAGRVEMIINQQLEDIRKGDFSPEAVNQTKAMLKNGLLQSEDSAGRMIEREYAKLLISQEQPLNEWIKKIEEVSQEEIMEVAKQVQPRATFLLKGEEK